ILLEETERWTGKTELARELEQVAGAALAWIDTYGARDGDGYVEYERRNTESGLENQCWKDSWNSIAYADGSLAATPLATCEIQGLVYDAKSRCARLAREVWDDGELGDRLEREADELKARFNRDYWLEERGFFALALDRDKRQVDSLTSNIGHLLSTGLLDAGEEHVVAGLLADRRLFSDYGLRTLDADHPHFNPLGYHSGSVWPHDTAIAVDGLVRAGHAPTAAALVEGLLDAAAHFDFRLPELFGGWASSDGPLPYPAACRPQAWAAGCALVVVGAALGLSADVPGGSLTVRSDEAFAALYPLRVEGLRIAGHRLDIAIDADGRADVTTAAALTVRAT
nr:amylo-alpha-1,6-glucosidase [Acidimicrobiia bacterium]